MEKFNVATYFDTWGNKKKQKVFNQESKFIIRIINEHKMKKPNILDVGCGIGLHIKNLLEKGYNVDGIDISKEQIKKALSNIKNNKSKIFRGDIKKISLKKRYNFIYSIQYALNYSLKNDEMFNSLRNINKHMKPNAILIFELMNPYKYLFKYRDKTWKNKKEIIKTKFYPLTQTISATEHYPKEKLTKPYKIRLFFPEEINFFLQTTGFKILNIFGNYNKKKFSENSEMIFLCRKNKK